MQRAFRVTSLLGFIAIVCSATAQTSAHTNKANWKLSDRFSAEFTNRLVGTLTVTPNFINDTDTFWYSWKDAKGTRFMIVDPRARTKKLLFDSSKMAALLSEQLKKPYDYTTLPISVVVFSKDSKSFTFVADETNFEYTLATETLVNKGKVPAPRVPRQPGAAVGGQRRGGGGSGGQRPPGAPADPNDYRSFSPDKKSYVYGQGYNLYFVDTADEKNPVQLSKDGERYYGFGRSGGVFGGDQTVEPAADRKVSVNVSWSKDSKYFFVTRSDSRKVSELFLVDNLAEPRPKLQTYKYAMPGEPNVTQTEFWLFDRDKKAMHKVDTVKYKDGILLNNAWTEDNKKIRFTRRDRLQRHLEYCELDAATDKITVLLNEAIENGFLEQGSARYVKPGGDFVWWSERDGWGHAYLYDYSGKLKNRITEGPWRVDSISEIDEKRGLIWFKGVGKEPNENPYFHHTYRSRLDGRDLTLLDSGDAEHNSTLSPTKTFLVDTYSRVDLAPESVLRDDRGHVVLELEKPDLTALKEAGWKGAEVFSIKSADGVTDIYGDLWKPFDFDAKKKYPIILNVYPGPQTESVASTFSAFSTTQRLANLGFIVIQVGNRGGNPQRSKAYHSYGYYNLRDYGLEDKKLAVEELAAKYSWIDQDRVGIFGHSGGGFMSSAALLVPPYNEFFKVAVSSSGNHDNNIYNQNWSEQHHGLKEVKAADGTEKFEIHVPTNIEVAANLKGNLLLVTGDMDNNVHPANTIRLANALIKAGKRFDFMLMPGKQHGYADLQPYFTQLLMEYFAEHLLGDYYRGSAEIKVKG